MPPKEVAPPEMCLVVDMTSFYEDFDEKWSYLRKCEKKTSTRIPNGIEQFQRFENCIECGACISACPVVRDNRGFIGPAVLAGAKTELEKTSRNTGRLLSLADGKHGTNLCRRALNCSRVCPTGVYPARQIADLQKLLKKNK